MTKKQNKDIFDEEVGKKLYSIIKEEYKTSMSELAIESEIEYKTLWNCKNGDNTLSISTLLKIVNGLNSINRKRDNNREDATLTELFEYLIVDTAEKLDLLK